MSRPLPARHFFLLLLACAAAPAYAHAPGSAVETLGMFAWRVDAWVAASVATLFWLAAARGAVMCPAPVAWSMTLLALAAAVFLSLAWHLDAWIVAGLFLSAWLYGAGVQRLWHEARANAGIPRWRAGLYCAGLASLIVALLSPVDTLGEELFSMHMVQHELMMLIAAPLLVAGRPLAAFIWAFPLNWRKRIGRAVRQGAVQRTWGVLVQPSVAWLLHALILWAWHFPALFQAGLANEDVHTLQHLSFLVSALLFWSSLVGPSRMRQGSAVLYVLTTAIHTGILGALLTFSPRVWYPVYAGRTEAWGLTALEDQQLGGLIMWVPAGFVFVIAGLIFAARAIGEERSSTQPALQRTGHQA